MSERAQALEAALRRAMEYIRNSEPGRHDTLPDGDHDDGYCCLCDANSIQTQAEQALAVAAPPVGVSPQPDGWQLAALLELADDLDRIVLDVSSRDGDATARQHQRAAAVQWAANALSPASLSLVEPTPWTRCEACDAGMRRTDDGVHYDDTRGGATWGVCRLVVNDIVRAKPTVEPAPPEREPTGWYCGCGWANGLNLNVCGRCTRPASDCAGDLIYRTVEPTQELIEIEHDRLKSAAAELWWMGRDSVKDLPTATATGPQLRDRCLLDIQDSRILKPVEPTPPVGASESPSVWRCFHCDMRLTSEHEAREHFGPAAGSGTVCALLGITPSELQRLLAPVEPAPRQEGV